MKYRIAFFHLIFIEYNFKFEKMPKTHPKSIHTKCESLPQCAASSTIETRNDVPLSKEYGSKKISETFNETDKEYAENTILKQQADMQNIVNSVLKLKVSNDVSDDARKLLAEQCSLKLKRVVESSVEYMKSCGRQKFTVEDFNKGLIFCGEAPLNSSELSFSAEQSKRKNSKSESISSKTKCQKVCYEGDQCVNNDEGCSLHFSELFTDVPQTVVRNEKWLNNKNPLSVDFCDLAEELQVYYTEITKTLISETEEACCIIFNDFKTNENIYSLVPYFIRFLCDAVDNYKSDFVRISVLLKSIQALLLNPNVYYGENMYLDMLAHSLLKFLLAHLPCMNQGIDYWLLKDTTASILALVLKRSNSKVLFFDVLGEINDVLCDFMKGIDIHYGALITLNSIGVPAIFLLIPPYLDRYIEHMNSTSVFNFEDTQNFCMIHGLLMHSYFLLVNHCLKYEFSKHKLNLLYKDHSKFYMPGFLNENSVFPILLQSKFKEYFGDSLVPRYDSLLNSTSHLICSKEKREKTKTLNVGKKCPLKKSLPSYSMLLL